MHPRQKPEASTQLTPRASWDIDTWCAAVGVSRPTYYRLAPRPRSVKLGRRRLVTEAPASYLERVAALQS